MDIKLLIIVINNVFSITWSEGDQQKNTYYAFSPRNFDY